MTLTRREFAASAAATAGICVAPQVSALAQQSPPDRSCFGGYLGATREQVINLSCYSKFSDVGDYLFGQDDGSGYGREEYFRFENDLVTVIEARWKSESRPTGAPLEGVASDPPRFLLNPESLVPRYAMTVGLSTKTTGYAALIGTSQPLAELNGRSGYFLKLYSCSAEGMYVKGIPSISDTFCGTEFTAVETHDTFTVQPKPDDGSPRLRATKNEWDDYYGAGVEGENYTYIYADVPGSPNVWLQPHMRGIPPALEAATYNLDLDTALDFVGTVLPHDALLESTFLLPSSPGAPWSMRLQQYASDSIDNSLMVLFIYRGEEGKVDLDAAIVSTGTQLAGWYPLDTD